MPSLGGYCPGNAHALRRKALGANGKMDGRVIADIDELQKRVRAAEQRFGQIDEQRKNYGKGLADLVELVEKRQQEKRDEVAQREAQVSAIREENEHFRDTNEVLRQENETLRTMLSTLLNTVERGEPEVGGGNETTIEQRLFALVSESPGESANSGIIPAAIEQSEARSTTSAGEAEAADTDSPTTELVAEETAIEHDLDESATDPEVAEIVSGSDALDAPSEADDDDDAESPEKEAEAMLAAMNQRLAAMNEEDEARATGQAADDRKGKKKARGSSWFLPA